MFNLQVNINVHLAPCRMGLFHIPAVNPLVFPDAPVKIFLDASSEERAQRRMLQLQEKGFSVNFDRLLSEIKERDDRDRNRAVAPLVPAEDALVPAT